MNFFLKVVYCSFLAGLSLLLFAFGAGMLCHGVELAFLVGWNAVTLVLLP